MGFDINARSSQVEKFRFIQNGQNYQGVFDSLVEYILDLEIIDSNRNRPAMEASSSTQKPQFKKINTSFRRVSLRVPVKEMRREKTDLVDKSPNLGIQY